MHPTKWIRQRLDSVGRKTSTDRHSESRGFSPSTYGNYGPVAVPSSREVPTLPPIQRVTTPLPTDGSNVDHDPPAQKTFIPISHTQLSPPSHRALESYDILILVLETLVPARHEDRLALAHAALVSRAFAEPASSILWRDISSMEPLWAILRPSDFPRPNARGAIRQVVQMRSREAIAQAILRAKSYKVQSTRERLVHCTARVRCIRQIEVLMPGEYDLVATLVKLDRDTPLFPSLQILQLHNYSDILIHCLLASRSLQTLDMPLVFLHLDEERLYEALSSLTRRSPFLRVVSFQGKVLYGMRLLEGVSKLTSLQELSLGTPLSAHHVQFLGTLSSLETLNIHLTDDASASFQLERCIRLAAIRNLTCTGECRAIAALISVLQAPALTDLNIDTMRAYKTFTDYSNILRSISSSPISRSLRALTLKPVAHGLLLSVTPLSVFLQPLSTLAQLEHVTITIRAASSLSLSDDDFLAIARTWPSLRTFALLGALDDVRQPYPSLRSLAHFARHCPALRALELHLGVLLDPSFDLDLDLAPMDGEGDSPDACPCRVLWVRSSPRENPDRDARRIAKFLDSIFPELDIACSGFEDRGRTGKAYVKTALWKRVEATLWELRERRWRWRRGGVPTTM